MNKDENKPQGCLKRLLAQIGAVLSAAYLANLGVGIVDLIPDNFMFVGNIDEVVVSLILFICLDALGIGPERLLKKGKKYPIQRKSEYVVIQDAEIVDPIDPKESKGSSSSPDKS